MSRNFLSSVLGAALSLALSALALVPAPAFGIQVSGPGTGTIVNDGTLSAGPRVTSIARLQPGPVTLADTITWRVTFSEPVTGVDVTDFTLTLVSGTVTGAIASVSAGASAAEYTVAVASVRGLGTLRLDVKASGTGIANGSSIPLSSGFTFGQSYTHSRGSSVLSWGGNLYGQLGHAPSFMQAMPGAIGGGDGYAFVTAGSDHSLGLTADGRLYAWGGNYTGELGDGTTTNRSAPVPVDMTGVLAGKTVVAAAAGYESSYALTSDGRVYAWGNNASGELGNGSTTDSPVPVEVDMAGALAGKRVIALAAGSEYCLALASDGQIYAWGGNAYGRLGDGTMTLSPRPVAVHADEALRGSVVAIAAGQSHSMALTSQGQVYTWGSNYAGLLGNQTNYPESLGPVPIYTGGNMQGKTVTAIAAGDVHCLVLTSDGLLFSWGSNVENQLGALPYGQGIPYHEPLRVAISDDIMGKRIVAISAGGSNNMVLDAEGNAYGWGNNTLGQVGVNNVPGGSTNVAVAVDKSVADGSALAGRKVLALGGRLSAHALVLASASSVPVATVPVAALYKAGDVLNFTMTWDDAVAVSGTPRMALTIGSTTRYATYSSGSGTAGLTFSYTVQAGDYDADGIAVASAFIDLNGGSLTDLAGNAIDRTVPLLNTAGIRVDAVAPQTSLSATPASLSASNSATFAFSGDDASGSGVESFEASLDGGAYAAATSPVSLTGLADGAHTFAVRAVDNAGNKDASPATCTWTVDTTPPAAPVVTSGNSVPSASPTFTGTAEAGSTVTITERGQPLGSAVAGPDGRWIITAISALQTGVHTLDIAVSDAAGNGRPSTSLVVTAGFSLPVPDGYAAGTTGGGDGASVVAFTAAEFTSFATSNDPRVITVAGSLDIGTVAVASNKTIQGADRRAALKGCMRLNGVSNVIVRGLQLSNLDGDALQLTGANRVFITHCTFFDSAGRQIVTTNSDNVTISWCAFGAFTAGQAGVQIGTEADTQRGHVTLHHNGWFTNLGSALPQVLSGYVHQYSDAMLHPGNTTGTVVGGSGQLLSERNLYHTVSTPLTQTGAGLVRVLENTYTGCTGAAPVTGDGSVFTPNYSYTLLAAADLADSAGGLAGNTAGSAYADEATGSVAITASATTVNPGASFTLTAQPTGVIATGYQWRLNNAPIPGATAGTYTVSSMSSSSVGTYTVVLALASGDAVISTPVTITLGSGGNTGGNTGGGNSGNSGGGGGGGAPSVFFLGALALLAGLRARSRRNEG